MLALLFSVSRGGADGSRSQEKFVKKETKLILFTDDMAVCARECKEPQRNYDN